MQLVLLLKVLVFAKTAGYHHKSIDVGMKTIQQMGVEHHFDVDTTTDATKFTKANLKKYKAVIFLNTTGDVLDSTQQLAFQQYIQKGGGFVGIHAATDTEYGWPWYGKLVGAYFGSHPKIQEATLTITDSTNIATKHLPNPWKRTDEWYSDPLYLQHLWGGIQYAMGKKK